MRRMQESASCWAIWRRGGQNDIGSGRSVLGSAHYYHNIVRAICGVIFVASGVLKVISPIDYFAAIASLVQVYPADAIIAVLVPVLEMYFGFCLLLNRNVKGTSIILLVGILAVNLFVLFVNPQGVRSCGCFGDFVPLPLDYTFYLKNIILSTMLIVTYQSAKSADLYR
ncbi:MAG: hypothetical protein IH600_16175 [Bacteroidetes bacterium]|nr:hypothetical protein [Bacteroidota bacterium]